MYVSWCHQDNYIWRDVPPSTSPVLPIFSINLGVGYNVFQQGEDTQGWYQILALKTSLTHHLFLHVGYQLSKFKDPNNLMLGLGWRF